MRFNIYLSILTLIVVVFTGAIYLQFLSSLGTSTKIIFTPHYVPNPWQPEISAASTGTPLFTPTNIVPVHNNVRTCYKLMNETVCQ